MNRRLAGWRHWGKPLSFAIRVDADDLSAHGMINGSLVDPNAVSRVVLQLLRQHSLRYRADQHLPWSARMPVTHETRTPVVGAPPQPQPAPKTTRGRCGAGDGVCRGFDERRQRLCCLANRSCVERFAPGTAPASLLIARLVCLWRNVGQTLVQSQETKLAL